MLTSDRLAGFALALFALYVIWESRALPFGSLWEPGPGYMPVVLASLLFVAGILIAAAGGRAPRPGAMDWAEWRHAAAILATGAFTALAFERLGYRLTVFLALFFLLKVVERKGWILTAVFGVGMAFGTFFLFDTILRVRLPLGPFGL